MHICPPPPFHLKKNGSFLYVLVSKKVGSHLPSPPPPPIRNRKFDLLYINLPALFRYDLLISSTNCHILNALT